MSAPLLTEWIAFSQLEPFGFQTDMYGHGIVASVLANIHKKRSTKAFSPQDFIPKEKENKSAGSFIQGLKDLLQLNKKKDK